MEEMTSTRGIPIYLLAFAVISLRFKLTDLIQASKFWYVDTASSARSIIKTKNTMLKMTPIKRDMRMDAKRLRPFTFFRIHSKTGYVPVTKIAASIRVVRNGEITAPKNIIESNIAMYKNVS